MATRVTRLSDGPRAALLVLVCVLAVSCSGRSPPATEPDRQPAGAWPTHGGRIAEPQAAGIDSQRMVGDVVVPAVRD
jgi:hypothetical protein